MMTEQLKTKIIEGDNVAFTQVYNEYCNKVYSVALNVVKDEFEAEDVMQEVFMVLSSKIDNLGNVEKFDTWLFHMTKNKAIDFLRKRKDTSFTEVEASSGVEDFVFEDTLENDNRDFVPEESLDYSETKRIIDEIIDSLPEEQKECVNLRFINGYSLQEIADATGVPLATVKSRLKYGKGKIETEVAELEKKGVKLYGVSGLLLIPFLRWMLTGGNTFSASLATASSASAAAASVTTKTGLMAKLASISNTAKAIIAGCVVTATVGAVVVGVVYSGPKKIDIEDYITVTYSGYNGYAVAEIELDEDAIDDIEIDDEALEEYLEEELPYHGNMSGVKLSSLLGVEIVEDNGSLKNGDTITVRLILDCDLALFGETVEDLEEAINIDFTPELLTFTVSDLDEPKILDCLSFAEEYVEYDGASGDIKPAVCFPENFSYTKDGFTFTQDSIYSNSLTVTHKGDRIGTLNYYINEEGLSKGDTFTITHGDNAYYDVGVYVESKGYILSNSHEVKVPPTVPEYLLSPSQLTEAILEQLKSKYLAVAESYYLTEITDVSAYIYNIKPEHEADATTKHGVIVLFHTTRRQYLALVKTGYVMLESHNVKINADGTIISEFDMPAGLKYGSYFETFEDIYQNGLDHEHFTFEKIF